jgi:hypothetical protein
MSKLQSTRWLWTKSYDKQSLSRKQRMARSLFHNGLSLVVGLTIALPVQAEVAQMYHSPTNVVAPEVPQGSRLLVYKLAASYEAGSIVVYKENGEDWLGRVVKHNAASGKITVSRNGKPNRDINLSQVVGRVVFNTR